jgi:hypothetical protein
MLVALETFASLQSEDASDRRDVRANRFLVHDARGAHLIEHRACLALLTLGRPHGSDGRDVVCPFDANLTMRDGHTFIETVGISNFCICQRKVSLSLVGVSSGGGDGDPTKTTPFTWS